MNVYTAYSPPAGAGGGLFLKMEPDTKVKLQLASDPYVFNSEYAGKVSTKYAWTIWNHDDKKAQILQLPVTAYRNIAAIAADEEWGDPTQFSITLFREGSGKETKYHLTPSPNKSSLTKEQKDEVAKVEITKAIKGAVSLSAVVDGAEVPVPQTAPESDGPPASNYENDPFEDGAPF